MLRLPEEWRRQCHSKQDIELVQKHLEEHIRSMRADRATDANINMVAQQSARGEVDASSSILSLTIDGMDEAKFRIPRRLDCSKQMNVLWRPECRFIGVLCEGHSEGYYIGDCDLIKGASLDLTLISHVITEVQQSCQEKGIQLPGILRLHSDNASSELKNVLQDVSMIFLEDFYGNSYGISLRFLCYSMLFL